VTSDQSERANDDTGSRMSSAGVASVGIQVDLPVTMLYGTREPTVYEGYKFRPDTINKYGDEVQKEHPTYPKERGITVPEDQKSRDNVKRVGGSTHNDLDKRI